jgi:hypothetical protein
MTGATVHGPPDGAPPHTSLAASATTTGCAPARPPGYDIAAARGRRDIVARFHTIAAARGRTALHLVACKLDPIRFKSAEIKT